MNMMKLKIINAIVPSTPNHEPVLPVNNDFTESRSRNPRKVLPANIIILILLKRKIYMNIIRNFK